jgi:hypothetical protein
MSIEKRPLTRKQKAFIKELLDNPKQSATKALMKTYGKPGKPIGYNLARSMASENLAKPSIQEQLENYGDEAVSTIYQIMKKDYSDSRSPADTRLKAAQDIADRANGKATQRVQVTSVGLQLTVDLSSE